MTPKYETVRSAQNQFVSLARSLNDRKNRQKNRLFRFDGVKLLCESLQKGVLISFLLVSESRWDEVGEKCERLYGIDLEKCELRILPVADTVFERLTDESAPEGVIGVASYMTHRHRECDAAALAALPAAEKILILESVRDPLNVGAILRVAAAFSVDRIIMSRDCADIYNPKTLRASMGTLFSVSVDRVEDIPSVIRTLKDSGRRVFAAALDRDAVKLGELALSAGDCVLIGNEGHGLSPEAIEAATGSVFIPMAAGVESLNAATATAVLLWEFFGKG